MTDTPEPNPNNEPADSGIPAPYEKPDTRGSGRDLSEREGSDGWPNLMAEFLGSKFAVKTRGFLNPYAAHVVFMTRMTGSSRTTAAFFAEKLQRKITRRPVEDIINKVRRGEIVITREQLAAVASEHPMAKHYAELNPDVLDPATAVGKPARRIIAKVTTDEAGEKTTVKNTAKKKAAKAKKVPAGKTVVKIAAKKPTPHRRGDGPKPGRLRPDPGPELPGLDNRE